MLQVQLADARYANGLGSQIELADAQFAVTTAEGNLVQTQWQLADAWAQLRRALGSSNVRAVVCVMNDTNTLPYTVRVS